MEALEKTRKNLVSKSAESLRKAESSKETFSTLISKDLGLRTLAWRNSLPRSQN